MWINIFEIGENGSFGSERDVFVREYSHFEGRPPRRAVTHEKDRLSRPTVYRSFPLSGATPCDGNEPAAVRLQQSTAKSYNALIPTVEQCLLRPARPWRRRHEGGKYMIFAAQAALDVDTDVDNCPSHTRVVAQILASARIAHRSMPRLRRHYRWQSASTLFRLIFHRCGLTANHDTSAEGTTLCSPVQQHRRRGGGEKEPQTAFGATGRHLPHTTDVWALGLARVQRLGRETLFSPTSDCRMGLIAILASAHARPSTSSRRRRERSESKMRKLESLFARFPGYTVHQYPHESNRVVGISSKMIIDRYVDRFVDLRDPLITNYIIMDTVPV